VRWLALFLLFACAAFAQPDTRHFPLERVNVNGSQRYPEPAIIAAMGLRPGQQCSEAQLQQVSAKLGNTGLFDSVEFRFGWGTNGVVATFNVHDSTALVPIGFENFVWFPRNSLAAAIKKKLPLFTGVVPLGGDYRDQIAKALKQILSERKIKGSVIAVPQGTPGHPEAMVYRVDGHEIKVIDCVFPGADHANQLELHELAQYIERIRYEKSQVDSTLTARLKAIYDNEGYLTAKFAPPEVTIVSTSPDRTSISLSTTVTEGRQFTLGGVDWTGNTVYSSGDLTAALNFPAGQIASTSKFQDALANVRRLYGKRGYLGVNMEITPELSPGGTARFAVKISEGSPYTFGKVTFTGIDDADIAKLTPEWTMKSGDIYDATYPQLFMATQFGKYFPGQKWEWRNVESVHEPAKTVDITVEVHLQ